MDTLSNVTPDALVFGSLWILCLMMHQMLLYLDLCGYFVQCYTRCFCIWISVYILSNEASDAIVFGSLWIYCLMMHQMLLYLDLCGDFV